MSRNKDEQRYTMGNIVVYAKHIYIARTIAAEAATACLPKGKKSGTLFYQGEPVQWHVIASQKDFGQE